MTIGVIALICRLRMAFAAVRQWPIARRSAIQFQVIGVSARRRDPALDRIGLESLFQVRLEPACPPQFFGHKVSGTTSVHEQRLVPTAEQMAEVTVPAIKSRGVGTEQPLHAGHEVCLGVSAIK